MMFERQATLLLKTDVIHWGMIVRRLKNSGKLYFYSRCIWPTNTQQDDDDASCAAQSKASANVASYRCSAQLMSLLAFFVTSSTVKRTRYSDLVYVVAERQTVARKIHKKIQFQFFWLYLLLETTNWWRIPKVSDTTKNEIAKVDAAGAAVDVAKKLVKWDF